MTSALDRLGGTLQRLWDRAERLETVVGPSGPEGPLSVPDQADGRWQVREVMGRPCLEPREDAYYLYVVVPPAFRERARDGAWLEVEYAGERWAEFRVQYASLDRGAEVEGLYKTAEQRWIPDRPGERRFRRALFPLPGLDPGRTQNLGASLRVEFRREVLVSRLALSTRPPGDAAAFTETAPLPELRKLPGRFYPINYLFLEITNACSFKCTWCPDAIMGRRRGFMPKEKAFRVLEELAAKRSWLGPLYPVKLHQMGEPFLHPDLLEIVERAERLGVGVELNTNCGSLTAENVDALYRASLTRLILSYQTPDAATFATRRAPRLDFAAYRDKVRLAVERKVALRASTHLEIDVMNTKRSEAYRIVSEDEQALAFLEEWVSFAQALESRYGLRARALDRQAWREAHFLDQDENGSRYAILEGVDLVWKRCHDWGNVIGGHRRAEVTDTYCPAPYDQFVIQWNGDVVACCTDHEGRTKVANVFASSVEEVWRGAPLRRRRQDMLQGRLLDVCARCQGLK